ncbi:MAG: hypothetical protein HN683_21555, partial [Gammaproteobacteria bacterium]|nr:hypothetical protein [Gammaproteobacteria bacterium]
MSREPPGEAGRVFKFFPVSTQNCTTLSPEQIEQFNQQGYLTGINVFTEAEAIDLQRYIDQLVSQVVSAEDRRNSYSINNYHVVCQRL